MQSQSAVKKLVENLQSDLRALSSETKRKFPPVKEAAEAGILKIKTISTKQGDILGGLLSASSDIVQPFLLGCDTKHVRVVQICLTAVQRLIQHEAVSMPAANNIINVLWNLMEAGTEELRLLQTAILLLTTNSVVQHESLAKAIVLCFRLHFAKDSITINTAAATVRQLVSVVFERVVTEDSVQSQEPLETVSLDELKVGSKTPPKSLRPCAQDGYLLFQDLCQLVNADQPFWLVGMTEMTRTFGLELMEEVLTSFPNTFLKHPEFCFLLKERVCPLVIKLFSPSLKYRQGGPQLPSPVPAEKPYFPIVLRLLRIVSVLIRHYYSLLNTECEIFLSLLVKFLDPEKPMWQRALALEVLLKLCNQPHLLRSFCQSYDMKPHSTKIFRDIVNALGAFIQSLFMSPPTALVVQQGAKAPDTQGQPPSLVAGMPVGSGVTPQAAFVYRGVWIPIVMNVPQNTPKPVFVEMLEKLDPPQIPDGYGISLAFQCLLEIVRGVQLVLEESKTRNRSATGDSEKSEQNSEVDTEQAVTREKLDPDVEKQLFQTLIESSWTGMLAALSLLLDASTDESATEAILKSQQTYASMCGELGMTTPRDAFITSLCKASLPPHYALTVLNGPSNSPTARSPSSRHPSQDFQPSSTIEAVERSQVVAVGTALPTASLPMGAQQGPVMLTAKNIQCMRSILSVAHCHGGILGSAWHLVLTTLQHLVWILGLKPATGGSLKAAKQATESPNAVITTAIMADLPVLSAMLSRLFESSQYLDDVALHHLIDALCKLSAESMEHSAYTTREPSLFAVAKLLETGLVNLPRVEVLWKPLTAHLLEIFIQI
ncbi:protein MON2 homolog [Lingula anatina]|uniref:Protein MON2 homolog n=1 Tax=Lingula anatina TaxID=7574 RepID=A0A1S3JFQ9_LINAN|nr:protein MON2 homolog [Lingula anatina]|eukprot:XP_013409235.1 protein MON2 homolog [Lingula anatina]